MAFLVENRQKIPKNVSKITFFSQKKQKKEFFEIKKTLNKRFFLGAKK